MTVTPQLRVWPSKSPYSIMEFVSDLMSCRCFSGVFQSCCELISEAAMSCLEYHILHKPSLSFISYILSIPTFVIPKLCVRVSQIILIQAFRFRYDEWVKTNKWKDLSQIKCIAPITLATWQRDEAWVQGQPRKQRESTKVKVNKH